MFGKVWMLGVRRDQVDFRMCKLMAPSLLLLCLTVSINYYSSIVLLLLSLHTSIGWGWLLSLTLSCPWLYWLLTPKHRPCLSFRMDKSHSIIWNFPYSGNLGALWTFSLYLAQCSYSSSTWPCSQQFRLWVMHFASGNMFLLVFFLRCATLKGPDPSPSFFLLWSQLLPSHRLCYFELVCHDLHSAFTLRIFSAF